MVSNGGSFQESPSLIRELCIPTTKSLSQLYLHYLLLDRKLDDGGIDVTKNGMQQLIGHILQGHGDLTARKE